MILSILESLLEPLVIKIAMRYLDKLSSDPVFRQKALEIYGQAVTATSEKEALDASKAIQSLYNS